MNTLLSANLLQIESSWILLEFSKSTLHKPTWLITTSTNLNSKGIPSTPATEQGGNQVELPTNYLPIRAIQAVEELAKVLKQFCTTTSGKEHFHHISPPCITTKQFLFLLWEQLPTPLPLCLLQFCHKIPMTPPPTCPYQGIPSKRMSLYTSALKMAYVRSLQWWHTWPFEETAKLFCFQNGHPLTYEHFISLWHWPIQVHRSHHRIGATTTAAQCGIPDSTIHLPSR